MNFLEPLVAEWYEYNGYFVRPNPRMRKRPNGCWDVELDVCPVVRRKTYAPTYESSNPRTDI